MNETRERQMALHSMLTHIQEDNCLRHALFTATDMLCALLDRAFGTTAPLEPAVAIVVELATLAYDAFVDIEQVRRSI
jgi:hypothetical protein